MELLLKLNHILHDYASNHANELPSLLTNLYVSIKNNLNL